MAYISLRNIDMHRKPNGKRLLTFGIIVMLMLTSFAIIALRPASANPERWWFLPGYWHYENGVGSFRNMTVAVHPADSAIPKPAKVITETNSSFDLDISAPNASGLAKVKVPKNSIYVKPFYIRTITYAGTTTYLWGNITAKGDGYGLLDTVGGKLPVDVFRTVIGDSGTYTITTVVKNNVTWPDPPGSSLVFLNLTLQAYSAVGQYDGTKKTGTGAFTITDPMPLYVTTGFTRTVVSDATPYPSGQSHPSMHGKKINGTGVPADPYTGEFTGVATGGNLDLRATVIIVTTYSDSVFLEVMVAKPKPVFPSEPITSVTVSPTTVSQGGTFNIGVTVHNGLNSSATCNMTVYANSTVIETKTGIAVGANATTTTSFTWVTTGKPPGKYVIKAELYGKVTWSKTYTFHDAYLPIGDFNNDGDVDLDDFAIFSGKYGTTKGQAAYNPDCDLDHGGNIDLDDFAIFSGKYGKTMWVTII